MSSKPASDGMLAFDWATFRVWMPTRSTIAISLCLVAGLLSGHPGGGLVAAAGAYTAGLGALQRIGRSCLLPMLLASFGTAISTGVGMVLGHQSLWFVAVAGLWALIYGLLTAARGGTSWVGLQCVIVLLVASAFHTHPSGSLTRSLLELSGGLLQTGIAAIFVTYSHSRRSNRAVHENTERVPLVDPKLWEAIGGWPRCLRLKSPICVYALRQALTVAAAAWLYHHSNLPSGYWVPMTAILVLKPDFKHTLLRGAARLLGTLAGAGLASLLAALLRPGPVWLCLLVVVFAWLSFAVFDVNYALYTLNLTAYIVFLIALSGLPAVEIVHRRTLFTALGGLLAILAHLDVLVERRELFGARAAEAAR